MERPSQSMQRLEDVPLDQRYCNNCDEQLVDESNIGDLWWQQDEDCGNYAVILCRTCA